MFNFLKKAKKESPPLLEIPTKISKEEILSLPLAAYEGETEIIQTEIDLKHAIKHLKKEKTLGFDTESRPSFQRGIIYPTALVQLAAEKKVFLFQLNKLPSTELLNTLWENKKLAKVGIAIHDDIRKLKELHPFEDKSFTDISTLSQKLGIHNTGLRPLVGMFLKVRISKSAQTSNWAQEELTPTQITYAATDAWMSRMLYLEIQKYL